MMLEERPGARRARLITVDGVTLSVSGWARLIGLSPQGILDRLRRWGDERALRLPKGQPLNGRRYGDGTMRNGYVIKSVRGRQRLEHILIVERIIGRRLPNGAVVHHVNQNRADNRNQNLVVCQDGAYHALLHRRQRAIDACGNADWMSCKHCKQYDAIDNLVIRKGGPYHRLCYNAYNRARYRARNTTNTH